MIVLFPSITTALRVQKLLRRQGINSQTVQTTKSPGRPNCGHALKLSEQYINEVKQAARQVGSRIKGIYDE